MAPQLSRARKRESGGPKMRFAGAFTWDRFGRRKVCSNKSATLSGNGCRNGHLVTTTHLFWPNQRRSLPGGHGMSNRIRRNSVGHACTELPPGGRGVTAANPAKGPNRKSPTEFYR